MHVSNKKFVESLQKDELFDSHCHLNAKEYDADRAEVVKRAGESGVPVIFDMAINKESCEKSLEISSKFENVYSVIGFDPEICIPTSPLSELEGLSEKEAEEKLEEFESYVEDLVKQGRTIKVVGIGETGVDMFWQTRAAGDFGSDQVALCQNRQLQLFKTHIKVAKKLQLPLSIHSRNAIDLCIEAIKSSDLGIIENPEGFKFNGVFHSLTPDLEDTEESFYSKISEIHQLGFFVGLNAIFTFNSATTLRNTVQKILQEKNFNGTIKDLYRCGFVFETDGPYLAPAPHRGERNESGYIKYVWEFLVNNNVTNLHTT